MTKRSQLDPTCTVSTCPHGRERGGTQLAGIGWCGGVGTCVCCSQTFGYLHSSSHGSEGVITSSTQDETLCPSCGGKVTEYLHPDYEMVEIRPRWFEIRRKEKTAQ